MTTFAYRDGILVADSLISTGTSGYVVGTAKKILKTKQGILAAAAGNLTDVAKFLRWVEEGMLEDEHVPMENLDGIIIKDKNTVLHVEGDLSPYEVQADFYAGGNGAQIAIGAMAHGATAEEAVRIAIKYSLGTGGKIQKVML